MILKFNSKRFGTRIKLIFGTRIITDLIDHFTENTQDGEIVNLKNSYIIWSPKFGEFINISYLNNFSGITQNNEVKLIYSLKKNIPEKFLNTDVIIFRKFKYLNYNLTTSKFSDYNRILDSLYEEMMNYYTFYRLSFNLSNLQENVEDYPKELFD